VQQQKARTKLYKLLPLTKRTHPPLHFNNFLRFFVTSFELSRTVVGTRIRPNVVLLPVRCFLSRWSNCSAGNSAGARLSAHTQYITHCANRERRVPPGRNTGNSKRAVCCLKPKPFLFIPCFRMTISTFHRYHGRDVCKLRFKHPGNSSCHMYGSCFSTEICTRRWLSDRTIAGLKSA
jgi:hypothetical protein